MKILSLLLLCVVVGNGCYVDWLCQRCVESDCYFVTLDGENHLCLDSFSPDLSGVAELVTPGAGIMCPPSSPTKPPPASSSSSTTPATTSSPAPSSSSTTTTTSSPASSSSSITPAKTTPTSSSSSTTSSPASSSISPLGIFGICLGSLVSAALFLIVMLIMMRRKHQRLIEDFNQHDIL